MSWGTSGSVSLGELISVLEEADPNYVPVVGFVEPHSYRGYYEDLAFVRAQNVTVRSMLDDARSALGSTFQGWKGGDFTMHEHTDVWLVEDHGRTGEAIGPTLLKFMLGAAPVSKESTE